MAWKDKDLIGQRSDRDGKGCSRVVITNVWLLVPGRVLVMCGFPAVVVHCPMFGCDGTVVMHGAAIMPDVYGAGMELWTLWQITDGGLRNE